MSIEIENRRKELRIEMSRHAGTIEACEFVFKMNEDAMRKAIEEYKKAEAEYNALPVKDHDLTSAPT
jgi:hypothetical protein